MGIGEGRAWRICGVCFSTIRDELAPCGKRQVDCNVYEEVRDIVEGGALITS